MADSVSSNPEQQRIHQEGTDYIKEQIHNNPSDGPQGKGTAPQPVTLPEPPASNPGADDASGGIPQGSGGVSGTAHIESPVQSSQESGGIIDTVKGLLGLKIQDSGEKKAEDTEQVRNAADDTTTPAPSYIAGAAAATGATATSAQTFTADVPDRTRQTETTPAMNTEPTVTLDKQALGDTGKTFPSASADNTTTASSTNTRMDNPNTNDQKDSQPLPGRDASAPLGTETGGVADATKDGSEPQIGSAGHEEKEAASEKPPKSGANPKSMENRDAIPSAGGERLGDKHWGESKIVPDNPKPQNEAGVAASDNTDEVASNTAKNTGGATSGPHGEGEGKQKLTDKIKDKIPGLNKK